MATKVSMVLLKSIVIVFAVGAWVPNILASASTEECKKILLSLDQRERTHFVVPHLVGRDPVSRIFADFQFKPVQIGLLRQLSRRDDIGFEVTTKDASKNKAYPASRYFRASTEGTPNWEAANFFLEEAAHVLTMGRDFPFQGARSRYMEVMHESSWMGPEYDKIYFDVLRETQKPSEGGLANDLYWEYLAKYLAVGGDPLVASQFLKSTYLVPGIPSAEKILEARREGYLDSRIHLEILNWYRRSPGFFEWQNFEKTIHEETIKRLQAKKAEPVRRSWWQKLRSFGSR